jgi:hypothetical protein
MGSTADSSHRPSGGCCPGACGFIDAERLRDCDARKLLLHSHSTRDTNYIESDSIVISRSMVQHHIVHKAVRS